MNFILAIRPNIQKFNDLYNMIYEICDNYYNNKLTALNIKSSFKSIQDLYQLFTPAILDEIKSCHITYIEAILLLYLENKQPKYIKRLSCSTFNSVFEFSLKINYKYNHYALRLSKNDICKINFNKIENQEWYDNLLYYNDISLKTYLKFYPNIIDSCYYYHCIDFNNKYYENKNKIYYTHWSVSKIYTSIYDINKYRSKYIQIVKQLLKIFEKNELLYFDWKINNFMVDNKDNLILVDTDFENIYSLTAVCSTHRLTPDPSEKLNKLQLSIKILQSMLLMYISAYLSIISINKSKTISEYYMSFKFINKIDKMINNESTINSVISIVSNGKYNSIPDNKNIKEVINMIKNKINVIS